MCKQKTAYVNRIQHMYFENRIYKQKTVYVNGTYPVSLSMR